jgi:hypothetical protein
MLLVVLLDVPRSAEGLGHLLKQLLSWLQAWAVPLYHGRVTLCCWLCCWMCPEVPKGLGQLLKQLLSWFQA